MHTEISLKDPNLDVSCLQVLECTYMCTSKSDLPLSEYVCLLPVWPDQFSFLTWGDSVPQIKKKKLSSQYCSYCSYLTACKGDQVVPMQIYVATLTVYLVFSGVVEFSDVHLYVPIVNIHIWMILIYFSLYRRW